MKKLTVIFLAIIGLTSCSLTKGDEPNVAVYEDLIVYNYSFNPLCAIVIEAESIFTDTISSGSDLILSPYSSSSICFLSPSKDTVLSKSNHNVTGIADYGTYPYAYASTTGYYDLEYPAAGHWYFLMTEDSTFCRFFLKSFSEDSVVMRFELLLDEGTYFGE